MMGDGRCIMLPAEREAKNKGRTDTRGGGGGGLRDDKEKGDPNEH